MLNKEVRSLMNINLKSGKVCIHVDTRNIYEAGIFIRSLSVDIYNHLKTFRNDIHYIDKIIPNPNRRVSDVLSEYVRRYGYDKFIVTESSSYVFSECLSNKYYSSTEFEDICEMLHDTNFCNTIFNRNMVHSYHNGGIYIYNNNVFKTFIDGNIGNAISNRIINRIILR